MSLAERIRYRSHGYVRKRLMQILYLLSTKQHRISFQESSLIVYLDS